MDADGRGRRRGNGELLLSGRSVVREGGGQGDVGLRRELDEGDFLQGRSKEERTRSIQFPVERGVKEKDSRSQVHRASSFPCKPSLP